MPSDGGDLQLVGIVLVEGEAEHADAGLVGVDAGERLGVVAVDVDSLAVLADGDAGLADSLSSATPAAFRAVLVAAGVEQLGLEHFAGAVLFARDVGGDIPVGQRRVDLVPLGVRVVDQLAVDDELGGERLVDVGGNQRPVRALDVGGEDDAVIADLDFLDFLDAGVGAGLQLVLLDRARGVGDVDGVFADALAEFLDAGAADRRTRRPGS